MSLKADQNLITSVHRYHLYKNGYKFQVSGVDKINSITKQVFRLFTVKNSLLFLFVYFKFFSFVNMKFLRHLFPA